MTRLAWKRFFYRLRGLHRWHEFRVDSATGVWLLRRYDFDSDTFTVRQATPAEHKNIEWWHAIR